MSDETAPDQITRVRLSVPESELTDLHERLNRVRWPAGRTVTDTSQGPTPEKVRALVEHWRDRYDWRAVEAELNGWGLHRTTIDGLEIDFLHVRSPEPDALPLVLTHGWPGSVLEFRKVIGPLSDPAAYGGDPRQAFHLVIPVQRALGDAKFFWDHLSGYAKEQSTRPQTIGYSLADSPVGLAAWIYTMFQDTCGTPGDAEGSFTLDEILDDVMLYWLPNSGASAARLYWEMTGSGWSSPARTDQPIATPVGFTMPPKEAVRKSRRQLERRYADVVYFNEPAAGGHFFALEQPEVLVDDVRATFALLR